MKHKTYITTGCILTVLLLLTGCQKKPAAETTLPFYHTAELTPEWVEADDSTYASLHQIADFSFVNQDSDTVTSADFDGRIYVANFFFVRCTQICPTMRTNLSKIQAAYADDKDVLLLSHSVMPEADTVPILQKYADLNGVVSGKWHLVTGSREAIFKQARASYFVDLEADTTSGLVHSEIFVLIDQQRRIRGVYNGTLAFDVQRLIEDIALLKQASIG